MNMLKVPPHLALVHNGLFYSLSTKGVESGLPMTQVLKNLERKKIECLFIELKELKQQEIFQVSSFFEQFSRVIENENTCLSPIKSMLTAYYNQNYAQSNFLFELVPALIENNAIKQIYSLNYKLDNYELLTYSLEDINLEISKN